ncbi:ABC transporter permease [Microbacterium paludicola]|uniref:ABC transporter permease n=1 Tax=Microbacterium paludicola TaxID=300019 RepID=UPI001C92D103|nr:ABC transporter permease [Microbacterium paludicola]
MRRAAQALPLLSLSAPTFLVGLLLLQVFAYQLGWFSSIRDEGVKSLLLPALTLGIVASPPITRVLIQGLSAARAEPFVGVLRAKGMSESAIIFRHVLKNGSIPAVTLFGLTAGALLAGSVITETVFSRAGLGFVTEQAVRAQDGPVVLGVVLLVAVIVTAFNLLTDLVYPLIDPRIRIHDTRPSKATELEETPA